MLDPFEKLRRVVLGEDPIRPDKQMKDLPDNRRVWFYVGHEDVLDDSHMTLGDLRKIINDTGEK